MGNSRTSSTAQDENGPGSAGGAVLGGADSLGAHGAPDAGPGDDRAAVLPRLFHWIAGRSGSVSPRERRAFAGMLASGDWCRSAWGRETLPRVHDRCGVWAERQPVRHAESDLDALQAALRDLRGAVTDAESEAIHADLIRLARVVARAAGRWRDRFDVRRERQAALLVFEALSGAHLLAPVEDERPDPGLGAPRDVRPAERLRAIRGDGLGPGVSPASGQRTLRCTQVVDETADIKTFRLSSAGGAPLSYQPGQFVTVEVAVGADRVKRSYTLASAPSRPDLLEITVKRVPGGRVSSWLHDHFGVGDTLVVVGRAAGHFSCQLASTGEKILLVSGGSGISPAMSMSRYLHDTADPRDVVFLHSARTLDDVPFRRELALMAERNPRFCPIFTLTNEPARTWSGLRGRISAKVLEDAVPDLRERTVFLCGPTAFMQAVREALVVLQFPMTRFHAESFGGAPAVASVGAPAASADRGSMTDRAPAPALERTQLTDLLRRSRATPGAAHAVPASPSGAEALDATLTLARGASAERKSPLGRQDRR